MWSRRDGVSPTIADRGPTTTRTSPPRDLQRTFQLVLATIWLLDAVLQIQPFMFTPGSSGFSGMLNGLSSGNPSWVAHTITWNGSIVYHQPVLTNALFALVQFVIGFGIVWKRSSNPHWRSPSSGPSASGGSAKGRVGSSTAVPLRSAAVPGGVLFYAVLAVLLWPSEGSSRPFVAARTVGMKAARAIWVGVWGLLAVLSVVGSGRSPQALHDLVAGMNNGQPGWLAHIDRVSESFFLHHGTPAAILLAIVCLIVAAGVFLPPQSCPSDTGAGDRRLRRHMGRRPELRRHPGWGATDPNSGLLSLCWLSSTGR